MYHHGFRSVYKLNAHIVLVVKYRRRAINAEILTPKDKRERGKLLRI